MNVNDGKRNQMIPNKNDTTLCKTMGGAQASP